MWCITMSVEKPPYDLIVRDSKLVIVSFKIDKALLDKLDALAFNLGRARSEIIREAILEYLLKRESEGKFKEKKIIVKRYVLE